MTSRRKRKRHGKRAVRAVYAPLGNYRYKGSDTKAARLLAALADALNACEKAGLLVQLAHGAAICDQGYVIAPWDEDRIVDLGGRWVVRTRMLTEFPLAAEGGDEDG